MEVLKLDSARRILSASIRILEESREKLDKGNPCFNVGGLKEFSVECVAGSLDRIKLVIVADRSVMDEMLYEKPEGAGRPTEIR